MGDQRVCGLPLRRHLERGHTSVHGDPHAASRRQERSVAPVAARPSLDPAEDDPEAVDRTPVLAQHNELGTWPRDGKRDCEIAALATLHDHATGWKRRWSLRLPRDCRAGRTGAPRTQI